jgi:pimeloyl-ACP methyl ester carboxylesterase
MPDTLTCTVDTGRTLAWAEYGDPAGVPVLFLHGAPGGRLSAAQHDQRFARQGLRVIAPDRPGYGRSDAAPGHTVRDVANDLVTLLDACQLDRAFVVGGSGGGPYALALAATAPHRIRAAGILVGAAPLQADELASQTGLVRAVLASLDDPAVLRATLEHVRTSLLEQGVAALMPGAAGTDREQWSQQADAMQRALTDALAPGAEGLIDDFIALYNSQWGFDIANVTVPVVWAHGKDDHNVPITAAARLAAQLPRCRFITWERTGHAPEPVLQAEFYTAVLAATL